MQLNNLNSVNFGLKVETNKYNRTKAQKQFFDANVNNTSSGLYHIDSQLAICDMGGVSLKEDAKGNTNVSIEMKNSWGQPVETLVEKFNLKRTNRQEIKEQLDDFVDRALSHLDVLFKFSSRSPKKLRELIRLHDDAKSIEENIENAGWMV